MKLSTLETRLPFYYKARKSIHIKSSPGRGKSTLIATAPKTIGAKLGLNLGFYVINGAMLTPMDVLGYGIPRTAGEHAEMVFTDPFFFRTEEGKRLDEYDGGILFVDEADKADVDVKKVLGEGCLSGRFGPHKLPPGWVVWTAGNLATDRSGSTKELDHLINRRMEIDVSDDLESLLKWMDRNEVLPITQAFADQNPQVVFTPGVPDKQGPWCTPRSLVAFDEYMRVLVGEFGEPQDDPVTQEEARGMIGQAAAAAYFAFVKLQREMPKFEAIIKDPAGVRLPPETAPDARMLICYTLAHKVDDKTIEPVIAYIKRMPVSFSITFARTACTRSPLLATSKPVLAWVRENNSLMTMINSLGK